MTTPGFTESVVELAALAWLESTGGSVNDGGEIAPCEAVAERDDYGQVIFAQGLRDTLLPKLISGALRVRQMKPQAA